MTWRGRVGRATLLNEVSIFSAEEHAISIAMSVVAEENREPD